MSQSFFLRSIDSDLSVGGALFNRKLLEDTNTAASQVVSLAQSEIIDGYAWTEPGIPGVDGGAGDYTVSVHVTAGATQIEISTRLARVDSDGVVQAEGGFSTPDAGNAGVKVHTFESFSLGTWEAGDRLRVQYRFNNTDTMMARSLTIELNTVETELITPWDTGAEAVEATIAQALPQLGQSTTGVVEVSGELDQALSPITQSLAAEGLVQAQIAQAIPGITQAMESQVGADEFDPPNLARTVVGSTIELTWDASPTAGVADYQVFRRSPPTGVPFDPTSDTPIATGIVGAIPNMEILSSLGAARITSDSAFNPTDDIELRLDLAADWATGVVGQVVNRYTTTGDNRQWQVVFNQDGTRALRVFLGTGTGTFRDTVDWSQFPGLGFADGERIQVRVRLDADDGAGDTAIEFSYRQGADIGVLDNDTNWTVDQTVVMGGVQSWKNTTEPLILANRIQMNQVLDGQYHRLIFWTDLTKTTRVADLDFTDPDNRVGGADDTWADAVSANNWEMQGVEDTDWAYSPSQMVEYDDEGLDPGDFEYQVFGRVPA